MIRATFASLLAALCMVFAKAAGSESVTTDGLMMAPPSGGLEALFYLGAAFFGVRAVIIILREASGGTL